MIRRACSGLPARIAHQPAVVVGAVVDIPAQDRYGGEQLVQRRLRTGDRPTSIGLPQVLAMARCSRESATRWAAASWALRRASASASRSQARWSAETAGGGEEGRSGLDDPAEGQGVLEVGAPTDVRLLVGEGRAAM